MVMLTNVMSDAIDLIIRNIWLITMNKVFNHIMVHAHIIKNSPFQTSVRNLPENLLALMML